MAAPVFILGAGFSLAANRRFTTVDRQFAKRYRLVSELGIECFGDSWDESTPLEAAFESSLRSGNSAPVAALVKLIQTADYYLGRPEAADDRSIYRRLVERFGGAQYLSFNYDSLLEQVLLHSGLWSPHDGFGVRVETGNSAEASAKPSEAQVLHLHGSVLLYAVELSWEREGPRDDTLWMRPLKEPRLLFDPNNLGHCFPSVRRVEPGLGYRGPEQRVVAPIPDKTEALLAPYVRTVYDKARDLLARADYVIAIGYRFADCDRGSFDSLLRVVVQRRMPMCVVGPDARNISAALRSRYAGLSVTPVSDTFEAWAESDFPLPNAG